MTNLMIEQQRENWIKFSNELADFICKRGRELNLSIGAVGAALQLMLEAYNDTMLMTAAIDKFTDETINKLSNGKPIAKT